MSVQRPLSPHLQVYRPQLTSTLSILHRITGLFLCLGAIALIAWVWLVAAGPDAYRLFEGFSASMLGKILLGASVFALLYHLGNGIRHLVWDTGRGFDLPTAYASGWAVVAFAVIGSVAVLFYLGGVR